MGSNKTPWPPETDTFATYPLHCHCGAIRFKITISPPLYASPDTPTPYPVTQCACSYCERNGLLAVHPLTKNIDWIQGLEHRGEYLYGNKRCPQWFCKLCGSTIGTDLTSLTDMIGGEKRSTINVRMLKDFDLDKLTIQKADFMKSMPPQYEIGWDGK